MFPLNLLQEQMSRLYLALSAFTASANVPAIYLQQFWKTMSYNEKTGVYSCQVDEQWFDLSADLLRKALAITPINPAQPFELPPSGNIVIDFVNELGADIGRVYSRDPDIFLTQSKSQRQCEEPKEESNSSPHSLWTVFQGNLKFVPKGESVEVFGMAIPDPLITEAIMLDLLLFIQDNSNGGGFDPLASVESFTLVEGITWILVC
ncbi:hypothetical protein Tco_0577038 [Tanacetum coccineum]